MDDDRATVRFVERMIADAVARRASDIHLQPEHDHCRLRLRIDGLLREAEPPPSNLSERIIARLKLLSGMDVAERRQPQDGRLQVALGKAKYVQFRTSTCPANNGEKLVLRLIEQHGPRDICELGLAPEVQRRFEEALARPEGLILVTGPTGSGKSATLHAALRHLNTPERNICTVEDPVEMSTPGITQVGVNRRAELGFAEALRAFLRQDPDVIMIGEIRDAETASIAVKAAQTGHLVLSTLHTRSAVGAVERLARMGIPYHDLASSLSLIIAQRLVRCRCQQCNTALPSQQQDCLVAEQPAEYNAKAHKDCCHDGYSGRRAVFEALPMFEQIRDAISAEQTTRELVTHVNRLGIEDLATAGMRLVSDGVTTASEIRRATATTWL
ncbi:GspE/PulE family protein [Halorhodospira halochloris]|uniref:Type IV fimbrial assembly n=1 Tax=Halorhodospira halochloris TaxID=1052 RepID=A0A110B5K6_HALHR|nr:GspE/PulE family protein [Halorhodospira halochloris]MBK1652146.1 hypothetical protein [Halorhodospira halochloris]MCG5530574.1 GspE/PulE family protein [Halorhodospira halochloris]MCG5547844.1 GspE/PulE family protein [Halorhodospira halochloris]BAU58436.1 type IV fimbrial assembly [Halorhodospira halochloris]